MILDREVDLTGTLLNKGNSKPETRLMLLTLKESQPINLQDHKKASLVSKELNRQLLPLANQFKVPPLSVAVC